MNEITAYIVGDKIEDQDLILYLHRIIELTGKYELLWEESVSCNRCYKAILGDRKYDVSHDKLRVSGILIHEGQEIDKLRGYISDIIDQVEVLGRNQIIKEMIYPEF